MINNNDSDLLLLLLLFHVLADEDDPFWQEVLYKELRKRLRESKYFDPKIDHLIRERLYRRRKLRERHLTESREIAISVLEGFRKSFGEAIHHEISSLDRIIHKVKRDIELLQSDLSRHESEATLFRRTTQDYLWLLSMGIDISNVKVNRYIPVRIYVADPIPDQEILNLISNSISHLLEDIGFERSDEFPEETGSWWKKIVFRSKEAISKKELTKKLKKAERAAEIAVLDKPQAEANLCQAQAASDLISSLSNTKNACIQAGSLLVLKTTNKNNESSIIVRTLTPLELEYLEENQAILRKPEKILDWLQNIENNRLTNRSS